MLSSRLVLHPLIHIRRCFCFWCAAPAPAPYLPWASPPDVSTAMARPTPILVGSLGPTAWDILVEAAKETKNGGESTTDRALPYTLSPALRSDRQEGFWFYTDPTSLHTTPSHPHMHRRMLSHDSELNISLSSTLPSALTLPRNWRDMASLYFDDLNHQTLIQALDLKMWSWIFKAF